MRGVGRGVLNWAQKHTTTSHTTPHNHPTTHPSLNAVSPIHKRKINSNKWHKKRKFSFERQEKSVGSTAGHPSILGFINVFFFFWLVKVRRHSTRLLKACRRRRLLRNLWVYAAAGGESRARAVTLYESRPPKGTHTPGLTHLQQKGNRKRRCNSTYDREIINLLPILSP